MHAVWCAIEAHRYWHTKARFILFKGAMQSGAQLETQLRSNQIDDIAAQGAARRRNKAAGVLGQVQDPMHLVHEDARWRQFFDRDTMTCSFTDRGTRADSAPEQDVLLACRYGAK